MAAKKTADADANDTDAGDGEAVRAKRKIPFKLVIIGAAALIVIGGGAAGAYVMLGGKKQVEEHVAAPVKPVAFFEMPDVMVNLASSGTDRTQYLKIKVVLELPDQMVVAQLQPLLPRVVDAFQTYLRELRPSDLEGSAGLYRLRDDLTRRVNLAITPGHVNAVLFKEIIVQ